MIVSLLISLQVAAISPPPAGEAEDLPTYVMRTDPWSVLFGTYYNACMSSLSEVKSAEEYLVAVNRSIDELKDKSDRFSAPFQHAPLKGDGVKISAPSTGKCLVRHSGAQIDKFRHDFVSMSPFIAPRDKDMACDPGAVDHDEHNFHCVGPESLIHDEKLIQKKRADGSGTLEFEITYVSGVGRIKTSTAD